MKKLVGSLLIACSLSVAATTPVSAESADNQKMKKFVIGGQFKDLILPIPVINGIESEGLWGGDNVVPRDRDNGIEDNTWCYWGGNAIKGKDGKYHIAICRWKENTGHNGWFHSEVAHCVSDGPFGPYKITKTIVKKAHNPEVQPMPDGTYALHTASEEVYTSDRMDGDWKYIGRMKLDARGFRPTNRLGSNLTTALRKDNSIVLMTKGGDIAISKDGILGTYKMVSIENYKRNSGYAEDPVIWHSRHQYHCIYNHAQDRKSGYMRSLDGIHWKNEDGLPYDVSSTVYSDGTVNEWNKFERAKVMKDDRGRAAYLSLAVIDVPKGSDKGGDNHSSKHMIMPLTPERFISIVGNKKISAKTKKIAVKIEAENGFNPSDIDLQTLRFGSDSKVNFGGGCKAVNASTDGDNGDMIIEFEGENGLNSFDYDFKLIGRTKDGGVVVGYAPLPGVSCEEASLITPPVAVKDENLFTIVENSGLTASKATTATLYEDSANGERKVLKKFKIPALQPYQNVEISYPAFGLDTKTHEYELCIAKQRNYTGNWTRVDEKNGAVEFTGVWTKKSGDQFYMGDEMGSDKVGASVKFTFVGSRVSAFGSLNNDMGQFDVYIDGKFVESLRLSWGGSNRRIFQSDMLEYGEHTLELRAAKYSNDSSIVSVDGFSYI